MQLLPPMLASLLFSPESVCQFLSPLWPLSIPFGGAIFLQLGQTYIIMKKTTVNSNDESQPFGTGSVAPLMEHTFKHTALESWGQDNKKLDVILSYMESVSLSIDLSHHPLGNSLLCQALRRLGSLPMVHRMARHHGNVENDAVLKAESVLVIIFFLSHWTIISSGHADPFSGEGINACFRALCAPCLWRSKEDVSSPERRLRHKDTRHLRSEILRLPISYIIYYITYVIHAFIIY